ncbi:hypothetical protein GCM10010129_84450 [Streptomyces fumigatiscleroticus]|nr:hypothetical protein GCM10010129_84450 [Streptomyces fumigatiscleroticus]
MPIQMGLSHHSNRGVNVVDLWEARPAICNKITHTHMKVTLAK